ncbi:MAG: hypothetical protein L6R38_001700 [Xanthoria sp. 2 TBL-2021]|nr:MAG: hypothetical protein L6R38_001700 [Xanthoria sp. 2 TBL-2021]
MNASTGNGASRRETDLPSVRDAVNGIADFANNHLTGGGGGVTSTPSEGRTFTVDPNLLAPGDAGYAATPDNSEASGNPEPSHSEPNDKTEANTNGTQQLSVGVDVAATGESMAMGVGAAKKKSKSKKKPKSQRGLTAPTGFEEFYVDAPLTPAEHEVEKDLYDPEIPFSQRIEVAIQRYCARRNMDSIRKDVFDKYLSLGGISAGPKQFSGGLDATAMSDMSAADIALMKATHFVDVDKHGGEKVFEIDFEGCAKAFFSSRVPQLYYLSSVNAVKDVQAKTNIVRNFLNYLLHHDVCPEYKSQIYVARAICDLTDQELPKTMKAQSYFPGDFQTACSEIFGGIFQGTYAKNPDWAPDAESYAGMSPEVAHRTFKIGLAAQASDEVTKRYRDQNAAHSLETLKVYNACLEVTELLRADEGVNRFYGKHPAAKGLSSLGRLKAKSWDPPFKPFKDLTPEERLAEGKYTTMEAYEFFVEDYVLDTCFLGMKFETTVHDLSFGLKFFDNISGVFCSFYGSIPNEHLIGWRVPEDEPLPPREKSMITSALEEVVGDDEGDTANPTAAHGDDVNGEDIEETW